MLILLGIARGAGGVMLLKQGPETLDSIQATHDVVKGIGWGLVFIGLFAVISGLGVLLNKRPFYRMGFAAVVAFVLDGVLNGWLLFGKPGDIGTLVNVVVAGVIILFLLMGRKAVKA
jgi:hypothetical protein